MTESILNRRNIERALKAVERNKGAGGVDGMQSDKVRPYLNVHLQVLSSKIRGGIYKPSPVRKVVIPKPTGGMRDLGIPTVIDRVVQQAIHQVLSPMYEKDFSSHSYGFRRGKNAHHAVKAAESYLNAGYIWVVEVDLEKFFDRVNHQKLLHLLSKRVKDSNVLKLISLYLKSGILEGDVLSTRKEGTPQGSPLSPLLSNIVLHELDKELEKRGHKFVRYADDCSIYVKSERSAKRVIDRITQFIETKLLLKVNRSKSKVSRPFESYLLGFSFYKTKQRYEIRIHPKSIKRIKEKCKRITRSSDPRSERHKLLKLDKAIRGWVNYFKIAQSKSILNKLDGMIRTRLRISTWRRWKRIRTKITNLVKLGVAKDTAFCIVDTKGPCRVVHNLILLRCLDNSYYHKLGYRGFVHHYLTWHTNTSLSF